MSNDTVDAAFNSEGSIDPAIETPTALGSTMPTDVYRLTNFQSSTGLDFNGQENPVGVVCSTSNPNACSQYWRIIPGIVRGYYLIQNVATNAAVEAVGRN